MSTSNLGGILANELAKYFYPIVIYCIVITVFLIIAGLLIGSIKKLIRKMFKGK